LRGVLCDSTARTAMSPVIQIVAGHAVRYTLSNGVLFSEFEDREFYEVPDYAAHGMIKRRWAVLAKPSVEPQQPKAVEPVESTKPTEGAEKKRR